MTLLQRCARQLRRAGCLLCLLTACAGAWSQSSGLERQVKAAYLVKFASFVEWPDGSFAQADSPLVIGVAGADALAEQLAQTVTGRKANGRLVTVRKIRRGESVSGMHILFVGAADRLEMADLLAAARGLPLLTVSDTDEAHLQGSMINFVIAEDRLRFNVALRQVAPSHLRISARMLAAAHKVWQGAPS